MCASARRQAGAGRCHPTNAPAEEVALEHRLDVVHGAAPAIARQVHGSSASAACTVGSARRVLTRCGRTRGKQTKGMRHAQAACSPWGCSHGRLTSGSRSQGAAPCSLDGPARPPARQALQCLMHEIHVALPLFPLVPCRLDQPLHRVVLLPHRHAATAVPARGAAGRAGCGSPTVLPTGCEEQCVQASTARERSHDLSSLQTGFRLGELRLCEKARCASRGKPLAPAEP